MGWDCRIPGMVVCKPDFHLAARDMNPSIRHTVYTITTPGRVFMFVLPRVMEYVSLGIVLALRPVDFVLFGAFGLKPKGGWKDRRKSTDSLS